MNIIELIEKIKLLENTNMELVQEIQLYDCCSQSFLKELVYLKYKLELNNIVY